MTITLPVVTSSPRQIALAFEAPVFQSLSPSERMIVKERLATLLTQAAEPATQEDDNEER